MRGAGGTGGGVGRFFLGLTMLAIGGYLFLNAIRVHSGFGGMGHGLYNMGGFAVTTGMILVPFIFGIGLIFYSAKNPFGWVLAGGSLLLLAFGIIASLRLNLHAMSAFDLLVMLVLIFGGLGLFLSSLRDQGA
ncbi:MAG: hypothetical protein AAGD38_17785 [Acidobacteriota bacterium]